MTQQQTDLKQLINFLDTIFSAPLQKDEHILGFKSDRNAPGFPRSIGQFLRNDPSPAHSYYFGTATMYAAEGKLYNRQAQFARMWLVIIDDVGSGPGAKVPREDLVPGVWEGASYIVETSPDNYQLGFVLDAPIEDLGIAKEFVRVFMHYSGGDCGGAIANKAVRLPCGANLKDKYRVNGAPFAVRLEALTGLKWHPDDLLALIDCDILFEEICKGNPARLGNARTRGTTVYREKDVYSEGAGGLVDEVLEWLSEQNMIVNDNGGDWVDILCPWHDQHTPEGDGKSGGVQRWQTAGYSPLGRGDNSSRRGYHCFHSHDNNTQDFLEQIALMGGPLAGIFDPVADLITGWVFNSRSASFHNIKTLEPIQTPDKGFKIRYAQKVRWTTADGKTVSTPEYNLIISSPSLLRVEGTKYIPSADPLIRHEGQMWLNSWRLPEHGTTTDSYESDIEKFREFIEYLMPDDWAWFIKHLAAKAQNGQYRGQGLILTTPVQGSGRGTLEKMLRKLWGAWNMTTVSLPDLVSACTGKGFNDFLQASWLVVPEARDPDIDSRSQAMMYEGLKRIIDPAPTAQILKEKWGAQWAEDIYTSFVICSNHADVIAIPQGDRRMRYINCTLTVRKETFFKQFHAWIERGVWCRNVWYWLRTMDISDFEQFPAFKEAVSEEDFDAVLTRQKGMGTKLSMIALRYCDLHHEGLVITPLIINAIESVGAQIPFVQRDNWADIVRTEMNDATRILRDSESGKQAQLALGGREGVKTKPRHTVTSTGLNLVNKYTVDGPRAIRRILNGDDLSSERKYFEKFSEYLLSKI